MNHFRRLAATLILVGALSIGLGASPASADHVAYLNLEQGICVVGVQITQMGVSLFTSDYEYRLHKDGFPASYTCRFRDIPTYVAATGENYIDEDWVLPEKKVTNDQIYCWDVEGGSAAPVRGKLVIYPDATAVLTCRFGKQPASG
jgi:hypothetical protein